MNSAKLPAQSLPSQFSAANRKWRLLLFVSFSLVGPIIACFIVIQVVFGFGSLGRAYWFVDGLILSLIFNGIGMSPLLNGRVRAFASIYVLCVAMTVTALAYFVYERLMVALIGV